MLCNPSDPIMHLTSWKLINIEECRVMGCYAIRTHVSEDCIAAIIRVMSRRARNTISSNSDFCHPEDGGALKC
jgi:hypothetical protein